VKEPREHHVSILPDVPQTEEILKKASTEEEKAENKQYIPNKSLEGEFESQVKSHIHSSHRKNHEVKRLKPGHGTARDMLEITYPSPMLPTVPHQAPTRQNQKETRPHTLKIKSRLVP